MCFHELLFSFFRLTVAQGLRSNSSLGLTEGLLDLFVFLIEICLSRTHVKESRNEIKVFMLYYHCNQSVAVKFVSLSLSCSHFSLMTLLSASGTVCRPVFAAGVYESEELAGVCKEKQQLHLCTNKNVDGILDFIAQ